MVALDLMGRFSAFNQCNGLGKGSSLVENVILEGRLGVIVVNE